MATEASDPAFDKVVWDVKKWKVALVALGGEEDVEMPDGNEAGTGGVKEVVETEEGTDAAEVASELGSSVPLDDPDVVETCPNNHYVRYDELLGRGAFKTVYKAFDEIKGIEVAWNKIMLDDGVHSPEQLERVYSEVHLLKTLKHDNIMKSYVSWVDDKNKTINVITELFTSGDLRQYRKKHKSVDLKAIKNWARQILQGLVYLHGHEPPIIHRDLKCNNIFVNGNHGQVKIGDLGFATLMLRPTAKWIAGTPEFMAPELYEEEYNELVDIYAFGMCILELITCEYPYSECKNHGQIYKKVINGIKPAALSKVRDPEVKAFIEKCLVPVSQRPSAKDLLSDPFLAPESIKEHDAHELVEVNLVNLSSFPMDVDHNLVQVNTSSTCFQSLELQRLSERSDIRLKGERNEEGIVMLTLRIDDFSGSVRNIDFPFSLNADTAHTIAQEMVEELDLLHEDVIIIAELIDDMIIKLVPTWKPLLETTMSGCSIVVQNSQITSRPTAVFEPEDYTLEGPDISSLFTYSSDRMKSSEVFSSMKTTSNDSVLCENYDVKDVCEDLKKEIDLIEARYHYLQSELKKNREAAIEDAKRKWDLKKKMPFF
ncbi:putative serine/threonine-protein kinase WNK10 [Bidens hawaiensis]|uniref:putative serine/threonine-protein kinase WNK10 n=1 Tax=Bidens hawaiensis TaxID=980011 RepID=UPI00404B50E3